MDFNVCTERRQVFLIAAASSKNTHRDTQKYIRTLLLVTIGIEYLNTPKLQICVFRMCKIQFQSSFVGNKSLYRSESAVLREQLSVKWEFR